MSSLHWTEPGTVDKAPNIRVVFLDALRGIALLGIYWINIVVFSEESNNAFTTVTGFSVLNGGILTSDTSEVFIEGTMRGLFSILFGASAMVFLNEVKLATQGLEIVDRYYRRTLLLILFGVIHAYILLWPFDVLYVYGVLGMFLFPLRKISARSLLILGFLLLLLGDINIGDRIAGVTTPAADQIESISTIAEETGLEIALKTLTASTEKEDEPVQPVPEKPKEVSWSYFQLFQKNIVDASEHQSTKLYNDYLFDVGGMMIIGMSLLKFGVLLGTKTRKFYFFLMIFGYVIGFLARDKNIYNYVDSIFHFADSFNDTLLGYNLGRVFMTTGHIGLMGLIVSFKLFNPVTGLVVSLGRLALTNYIMQTLLSLLIFYVFISNLLSTFPQIELIYILLLVWLFQIAFSVIWLRYFKFGPLEWVWRSLIYGKIQPIK